MKKALFAAVGMLFALNLSANQPAADDKQTAPAAPAVQVQASAKVEATAPAAVDHQVAQNDQNMMNNQMNNQGMMAGGCENMSMEEKNFAAQLNGTNKRMFCNQFTPAQRRSAMQMMGTTGANGMKMSADQAVEQTARGGAPAQRPPGGCPVR